MQFHLKSGSEYHQIKLPDCVDNMPHSRSFECTTLYKSLQLIRVANITISCPSPTASSRKRNTWSSPCPASVTACTRLSACCANCSLTHANASSGVFPGCTACQICSTLSKSPAVFCAHSPNPVCPLPVPTPIPDCVLLGLQSMPAKQRLWSLNP